jgi:hypothetical protein
MLIGVPIKTPPPSIIEPTFYDGDLSLILKNKVDPDNLVSVWGINQISDDAVDDEVLLERRILAALDAWSSTVIIYADDIVSHITPPTCDDPNDLGSSGQEIVRLLAFVLKARSYAFAGNRDLLGNVQSI